MKTKYMPLRQLGTAVHTWQKSENLVYIFSVYCPSIGVIIEDDFKDVKQ